jgi:hypothetical protein
MNSTKHKLVSKTNPDSIIESNIEYSCECGQTYKHKQSLTKHIKYSCKNANSIEKLVEMVRLLNLQLSEQQKQINEQKLQIDNIISEIF